MTMERETRPPFDTSSTEVTATMDIKNNKMVHISYLKNVALNIGNLRIHSYYFLETQKLAKTANNKENTFKV